MLAPVGIEDIDAATEEELVEGFIKAGYDQDAARYLAGKLKGTIQDDTILR